MALKLVTSTVHTVPFQAHMLQVKMQLPVPSTLLAMATDHTMVRTQHTAPAARLCSAQQNFTNTMLHKVATQ